MTAIPDGIVRPRDLNQSLRRYFIDVFQSAQVRTWPSGLRVLDLGGHKVGKRGQFDLGRYGFQVTCLNITLAKCPHVQGDAAALPFADGLFDAVVCAELLEHVYDPRLVIREIARVLKPEGRLLATVPFLVQIHGDPHDFGRYTDTFWCRLLGECGFDGVVAERQGAFWSVILDAFRVMLIERRRRRPGRRAWHAILERLIIRGRHRAIAMEFEATSTDTAASFTTGFGIVGRKTEARRP